MDELNLYDDLDDFQEQQEKKSKELQEVEEKYQEALKTIEELQNENKTLKKNIQRMELGFQSLLDTARTEIKRKDKEIERLRKENDDICFRRKIPHRSTVDAAEKPCFRHHSSVENPFKMNTKDYKETALTKDSKVTSDTEKLDNSKRARCQDNERDHSNDHKRYRSSRDDYKDKNSTKSREDVKDSRSYYKDKDHNSRSVRNRSSERKDYDKPSNSRAQRRSSNSPENYNKRYARSNSREHDNKNRHERNRSRERKNIKESPKKSSKSPSHRHIETIHDNHVDKIETSLKSLDKKDNGNPKSEDLKEKNQNKTLKIVEDREQQEQSNSKKIICNLYNSKKQDSEETSIKESTGKTSMNSQLNEEPESNDEILKSKDLKTQKDVLRKKSNADHEIKCQYENVRKTVTGETSSLCTPRKVALFEELFGESPKETIRSKIILSKSAEMACSSSTTTSPGDYTDISSNLSTPKGNEIIEISSSNSSIDTNRDINDNKAATKISEKVVDKGNDIDECFIPNQHVKDNVKTIASVDLTEVIDDDLANEIEFVQIPGLDLCPRKMNTENINSNHKTETIATTNLLTDNNFWNIKSSTANDSQRNVCNDSKTVTDLKQMDNVSNSVTSSKTKSVTNLCTVTNKEMETLKTPQSLTLKEAVKVLPENQQENITKCSEEFDLQDTDNILNDVVVIETAKLGSIPPLKNPYTEENALEENDETKTKSKDLDSPAVSELEIGYKSVEKQQSEGIDIVKAKQKNVCDETLSSKKNSLEYNNTVNMTPNVTKSKIEQNLDVENNKLCPSTADIITSEELSTEINSADKEKSDDETANSEKDNVSSLSTTEITTCGEKVEFPLITSETNSGKTLEKETEAKSDDDKSANETEILEKDNISSSACESTNKEIVKENVTLQEETSSVSEEYSSVASETETTKELTNIDEQTVINSESKYDPNISSEEEQTTPNLCPQIDVNKESNVEENYKNNLDVENLDENDTSQHEKTAEYGTAKSIKINATTDEITCSEKGRENEESTDKIVIEGKSKYFENEISLEKNCETIVATNIDSDNDLNSQDPSNSFINNTRDDNNLCCTTGMEIKSNKLIFNEDDTVQESSTAVCLSNVIENKTIEIEESLEEINDEISELKNCASEDQILESDNPNETDYKIRYSAENKSLESTVETDDENKKSEKTKESSKSVNDENLITINSKDSIESAEELNTKSQPNIFKNNEIVLEDNLKRFATTTIDSDNELNLQNETEAVRESPSKVSISNNVENKTLRIIDSSEDIRDKDEISELKDCAGGVQTLESDNTNNTDDKIKSATLTRESPAKTNDEVTEDSSKAVNDENLITRNSKDSIETDEEIIIDSNNEINLQNETEAVQVSTSSVAENKTIIRDSSEDIKNETSVSEILESDNVNKTDEKVSSSASKTTVDILTSKSALSLESSENNKTVVPNDPSKEVNDENLITIDSRDKTHILETDECETTTYSLEVKKNALVEENLDEDATQDSPTETSCSSKENNKKIISSTPENNYDSLKEITVSEEKKDESALMKDPSSETSPIESCSSSNSNEKVISKESLEEKIYSFEQTPEERCPLIATSTIDVSEKDETSTEISCDSTEENTNPSKETCTLPEMKINKTASSKDSSFKALPMDVFHCSENNEVTKETLDTSIKISTHSIENLDSSSKKSTIEVCDSHETNVKNNSLKADYHKVPLEETSVIREKKTDETVMNNDSLIETSIMELSDSPKIHDEVISLNSEGNKCPLKETTIEQEKENNHLKITNDTEVNTKTVSIISDDNNVSTNTAQEQEKTYDTASTKDSSSTETTESFGSPQSNEKTIESTTEENGNFSKENSTLLEKNGAEAVLTTDFPTENLTVVLCASPETNEKNKNSDTEENLSKDTSTHSEQKIEMSKNTSNNACEVAVERKHEPTITNDSSVETIEICDSPESRATIKEGLVSLTPEESKDSSKKTCEVPVEEVHETQLTKDFSIETIEICDSPERRDAIKEEIVSLTPENSKDSSKKACEVPTEKIKESTLVKDSSIERIEMCDSPETRVSLTPEKSKDSTKQACEVLESALMEDSSIEPIEICDSPEARDTMKEEIKSFSPEKSKDSSKESCEAPVEKIHESSFTKDSSIEPIEICDSPETREEMKEKFESFTPEKCKDFSKEIGDVSVDKIQESTLVKDSSIETIEICDSPETREGMKEEIESLNSEKSKDILKKACEAPLEKIQDSTLMKDSSIETIEICDSHETRETINEGLMSLKNKDSSKEDSSIEAVEICDSPETNKNMTNLSPDENKVYSKENHVETEKNENKLTEGSTITLSPLIRSDSTENNLKIIELDSDESKDSSKQTIVSNEENYDNALTNANLPSITASKDNILKASNINKTKSNVLETFEDSREGSNKTIKNSKDSEIVEKVQTIKTNVLENTQLNLENAHEAENKLKDSKSTENIEHKTYVELQNVNLTSDLHLDNESHDNVAISTSDKERTSTTLKNPNESDKSGEIKDQPAQNTKNQQVNMPSTVKLPVGSKLLNVINTISLCKQKTTEEPQKASTSRKSKVTKKSVRRQPTSSKVLQSSGDPLQKETLSQRQTAPINKPKCNTKEIQPYYGVPNNPGNQYCGGIATWPHPIQTPNFPPNICTQSFLLKEVVTKEINIEGEIVEVVRLQIPECSNVIVLNNPQLHGNVVSQVQPISIQKQPYLHPLNLSNTSEIQSNVNKISTELIPIKVGQEMVNITSQTFEAPLMPYKPQPVLNAVTTCPEVINTQMGQSSVQNIIGKKFNKLQHNVSAVESVRIPGQSPLAPLLVYPTTQEIPVVNQTQPSKPIAEIYSLANKVHRTQSSLEIFKIPEPKPVANQNSTVITPLQQLQNAGNYINAGQQIELIPLTESVGNNVETNRLPAQTTGVLESKFIQPQSTTNKNVELNPLNLSDSIVNNKVNTITVKKLDIAPISTFNATSSVVCQNTEVQSISPEIQIGQTGSQICNVPENKSISSPKLNTTMDNNKLTIQVSSNACKISETQEANEKVDNEQNKCTSSQVSVIKSTLNEKIVELRPLENHEISKTPSTLNVQDAALNPSKTCQIIRSRAVETTVDKNQNEQAPLKMCNVSESPSNAKENVETNEITDIDVSQNEKETQHAHQKHDKEEYKTNIQQQPLTCPDKQKPDVNINNISEAPSSSNLKNNEEIPLEISQNNTKVLQELPKEVFQFQTPKKIQTFQTDLNAKAKIVSEQDNVHRVTSTLPETCNTTLPSISTNSPTPSNFSGIFSKKSSTLTVVEEDNKKSHKKSPQFKPREYVLPAASVLCNMDNLENATKATKKLHWELLEGKNEQTEVEDDADIASTDEEALIIKEEPLDNASTSPKQSNLGDQPICSKSQKSSPSETDTQTEDESLLNELRRQRGTSNYSSVVIPLKVHKLKQRKHKLPKNVKVKLKTLSRDTIESFKDTSLITQMPFSIVFPKRPVGRPRKHPDVNKKHKVEIIKQHKKRGRKPKNKPQEVNKCIILESKLDKSKELPMETLEDVCETQTNLLEYLKVRSKVVVNKQKHEQTINNNNERITEDLENNIENSVKILSTSVERLEICDEPCTSKESVKQLKSFDKQIDDFKYDDDHNTSMIYHKLDSSTDNTNISQQENSSQEWNSNLESKETGKNRYSEIPPDKSNSTKLDAVKKHQEWPSCSRVIQENTFSSVECTLRSDTDTDKLSSEDPSRDTRKEKSHKTRKLKKSLMKKKLKTKMKVKNKVTTFISLEDIGIKVKPLKAHLSTFRIPKIKKDHEESIANSWKLESYIENVKEKEKDKETTEDENYKESVKDKKQEQQEKQRSPKKKFANDIENVEISTASNSAEKATKDNQSETPSNFIINFDNKLKTGKRKLFSPDIYEEQVNENNEELPPDTTKSQTVNETCLYLSKPHEPNPVKLRRKSLHFPIKETTSSTNYSERIETSSSSNCIKPPKKSLNIHRRILDDSTDNEDDGKGNEKDNDKLILNETKTQTKSSSLIVNAENNTVKEIKKSSKEILNKKDKISAASSTPEIDLTASSANDLSNKKSLGNRRKSMCVEKISPELKETNAIEKVKPNIPKRRKSMYVERPPSTCSELEENEEKNPNKDGIERISPELQEKCALVNVKQRRKSMHVERSSPASNEIEETDNSKSTKVTVNRTSPVLKEKTKIESVKDDIPRRRKSMYVESSPPVSNEMGNTEIPKSREIVVKKISPEPKETDELAKVKQNIPKRRKSMYVERPPSASSEVEEIETSKLRKGDVERISPELKERSDNDKVIDKISKRRKSMYIERPPSTSSEMEEIESFKTKKVGDKKITPETIEIDEPISKKHNLPKRRKSMYVERPTLESNEIEKSETSKTKKDIVGTISTNIESTNQNLPKRRKSMYVERPPSASSEMEETETRISGKVVVERESPDLKVTKESQNIKQNIPERRKSMYVEKSSSEKTQSHKIDNIKDINESKQSTPTANSKIDENINKNEEVPKTIMSLKMRRKSMYSETASTSKVVSSKTNGSPKEASNVSNHTQIETIKDANQIAENPTMLCKPQQETDDKTRESPKPIVSLKMRRKSMYLERQEKEKIDEINKTKKDLDKQTQSSISQATEINEKNNDFIELNKNLSQKPTNKEVIENTIPKKEKTKDLYKTKPEVTKKLEDSKVDKQRDLSIQPNKIRRKSTYQEHLIDNENSLLNREIENKPKQNLDEKSAVTKSDIEQSNLDSSTKITQEFTIKLHRKSANHRSLVKEETNKSKDSLGRNRKDNSNPQEKLAVERETPKRFEKSDNSNPQEKLAVERETPKHFEKSESLVEDKELRKKDKELKNEIETTSSKHLDVITREKSIKQRRKSTNQAVSSGAGTNDELAKNSDIAVSSCPEVLQQTMKLNSEPEILHTKSISTNSTKVPQTVTQQINDPDSDSSMVMSQENSIKLRRKSTNQRRIIDSSSDDDNEPLIKKPTVISNEIKTPLTTANKTKSRRKRVVKVLSTSLESPTNPSHTSQQSSCSASPLTSPTLNHPIFNREVPSSEFAASMPMTPNQQDDNKFKEIDSKLHAIFQSPQYTVDYKISPAVDAANLAILPPPTYEAQPDVSPNETPDINQENDQSSINLTQINESSMCLNDTISASTSHNNSEVKHLCLGSSEYRIEKVNDNVINLFISRKRKRKRTN